jgi:DNA repair protein RecO
MAKGARRQKSGFHGLFLTGSICDIIFSYRENRGLQTLTEIDSVFSIDIGGESLERICIFQAAVEVLNYSLYEGEADPRPFDLMESFSRSLSNAADPWALFFAFEIGLLRLTGYFPHIFSCGRCGTDLRGGEFGIAVETGDVRCSDCAGGGMKIIGEEAARIIYDIDVENLDEILNIEIGKRSRGEIGRILHGIFRNHVEGYDTPASLGLLKGVI